MSGEHRKAKSRTGKPETQSAIRIDHFEIDLFPSLSFDPDFSKSDIFQLHHTHDNRDDAYSLDDLVGGRSGRFSAAGRVRNRRGLMTYSIPISLASARPES